MKEIYRDMCW